MTRCRMLTLIARVKLHVHHIPTFKVNIAGLPFLAFLIAVKNKATLVRSDEDHYLFAHDNLLPFETEYMF